jgi:N-methylhydantoinase A/oxoprolinase/acetone carboxylase beta subunit
VDQICKGELEKLFEALIAAALSDLSAEGFHEEAIRTDRSLDLRYLGQSYEITVPFSSGYRATFDQMHQSFYGYRNDKRAVEIVSIRVKAVGQTEKPILPRQQMAAFDPPLPAAMREVIFNGSPRPTPLFARDSLKPGMSSRGPAVIAGAQSTAVVPPDWRFAVDAVGTLVLTSKPQATLEASA